MYKEFVASTLYSSTEKKMAKPQKPSPSISNTVRDYVKLYLRSSTFHGVNYIANPINRHWTEALFWMCALLAFGTGAAWTIYQSYQRYLANPTVITVDKNYRTWNITFPASTFCFADKFDAEKAKDVVKRKWKTEEGRKFDYYMRFLKVLANSSYYNLGDFQEFQDDDELFEEDLSLLMNQVNFEVKKLSPTLFNDKTSYFFQITLEMGICYTVSSLLTTEFRSQKDSPNTFVSDRVDRYETQNCTYLHILCYGIVENLPRNIVVYVHSPYEVPIAASPYHSLYMQHQLELAYNQFDIKAAPRVRSLSPEQRRCYFFDEPLKESLKYYSFNTCIMQCRRLLAMRFCNCVPHFYATQEGQPICNIRQLPCIHERSSELLTLSQRRNKTERMCTCYQSCEDSSVVLDYENISKQKVNVLGHVLISTRYRWAIESFSKIRYKRDILFGMEELLVSFGGTACFFLGGSLMSAIEILYFFTVRLIRSVARKPAELGKAETECDDETTFSGI